MTRRESSDGAGPKRSLAFRLGRAVLIAVLAAMVIAVAGVNVYVRTVYGQFYQQAERAFAIPGINSGFVPQDLDFAEESGTWLFSGYMADHSPSPLYKMLADAEVQRLTVAEPDGSVYEGHGSAVTTSERYVFLACEGGYLVLDREEVARAVDGEQVRAIDAVTLDFTPAFMNIQNETLYVGNFYYPGSYETPEHHHIATPDGSVNPAVMYAYPADPEGRFGFAARAECVYSIPMMIQGTSQTSSGDIVLSQSYGTASSHLLVYDTDALIQDGTFTADGRDVPLYCLDSRNLAEDVTAPPMTEGIETRNGLVYVTDESASNKYIFGKLYGAGWVYALNL